MVVIDAVSDTLSDIPVLADEELLLLALWKQLQACRSIARITDSGICSAASFNRIFKSVSNHSMNIVPTREWLHYIISHTIRCFARTTYISSHTIRRFARTTKSNFTDHIYYFLQ